MFAPASPLCTARLLVVLTALLVLIGVTSSSGQVLPPTVVNSAATNITATGADLNGEVTETGGEAPMVTLYYGNNNGNTIVANWDAGVVLGTQSGTFTSEIFDLTPGTTYYFRAFAENSESGEWAPSTASFTTDAVDRPDVVTSAATSVTTHSAILNGTVTNGGGDSPSVTFYYGTTDGGTLVGAWHQSIVLPSAQSGSFSQAIRGLAPETTYFFRALAENLGGASWSPASASFITESLVSDVFINEFMTDNASGITDEDGDRSDWIELHNSGPSPINLDGWYLTDNAGFLPAWQFPSLVVPAGGYLVVFASSKDRATAGSQLHTNFSLAKTGEYLALVRPDGSTVASEFGPGGTDYPGQFEDISYGPHPASGAPVYFETTTPNAPNDPGGQLFVEPIDFSVTRGIYSAPQMVSLTTATPAASIYYTLDGSVPAPSDTLYTGPITVDETTTIRAIAIAGGFASRDPKTHSYFLIEENTSDPNGVNGKVQTQTRPAGYANLSSGDYNMDTGITRSGIYEGRMLQGLKAIPTLAISMEREDFVSTSSSNGIYNHSTSRSTNGNPLLWERPCSAEFLTADGRDQWQVNCGIRVQGGASRNPGSSPKHSLSLRFRDAYGPGRLDQNLFKGSRVDSFNTLSLRAGYNNSWIHSNDTQRTASQHIRDQWIRDSFIEMGNEDGGQGHMVHLFINGLYWGVHNLCERGDAAHYASYNGGDAGTLDARNGAEFIDGNSTSYNNMRSVAQSGDWGAIQQVLDIDNYIDYTIINRFGANQDLKTDGNWRAAGGGPENLPWRMYPWDSERTLESQTSATSPLDPLNIRGSLEALDEYRLRFADRLQKHFFNEGALTVAENLERWNARADELDLAIIAESARWGDHRAAPPYTRDIHWIAEKNRLLNTYFPARSANVLNRYRSEGLFPDTDAPVFLVNGSAQNGSLQLEIQPTSSVSLSGPGTVYYTIDGTDPRIPASSSNDPQVVLFEESASKSVYVPANATDGFSSGGVSWNDWDFSVAAGWTNGTSSTGTEGVGYGSSSADAYYDYVTFGGPLDLIEEMRGLRPCALIRIPFTLSAADLAEIASLTMKMRYEDGMVAYINGTLVAQGNRPATLNGDSAATGSIGDSTAVTLTEIDASAGVPQLRAGANVLAIHLLNQSANSSDVLCSVSLEASAAPPEGGGISPAATAFSSGFTLPVTTKIRARVLNGGEWSALNEATFYIEPFARAGDLSVSELHYHATAPTKAEQLAGSALPEPEIFSAGDFDFIEIHNIAGHSVNLDGARLYCGLVYEFGKYTMLPDERVVLVDNWNAFNIRYGTISATVFGPYVGGLDDGGELLAIHDRDGAVIQEFTYNDGPNWPGRADGFGSSLEILDFAGNYSDGDNWRSSCEYNGSPGYAGAGFAGTVVVNEVLAHTDPPATDAIELYNSTDSPVDAGGWFLSDDRDNYKKFEIPSPTVIPAQGYVTFDESDFNSSGTFNDFALSSSRGDDVWLLEADDSGKLLKFVDHIEFGASLNGESFGRWPNGTGALTPMVSITFGSANSGPRIGTIIISEIMYAPQNGNQNLEYIELCNTGDSSQNMANWTLRGGVDFDFTSDHFIPAGGLVIIVPFSLTPENLAIFRNHYGMAESVPIFGPWDTGQQLNNAGDEVRLQRPDAPAAANPDDFPQIIEDWVVYDDTAPWPDSPDAGGDSLHRISAGTYGNDSASWRAGTPTPGEKDLTALTGYAAWQETHFGPGSPEGSLEHDDIDADGINNLGEYALGLNPNVADIGQLPVAVSIDNVTQELTFSYLTNETLTGITFRAQRSSGLDTWVDIPSSYSGGPPSAASYEARISLTGDEHEAIRLKITKP